MNKELEERMMASLKDQVIHCVQTKALVDSGAFVSIKEAKEALDRGLCTPGSKIGKIADAARYHALMTIREMESRGLIRQ